MLELENITKVFYQGKTNEKRALDGISLKIEKGNMVGIEGPSGSGKSTFLHILGCIDRQSGGSYRVDGEEVKTMTKEKLAYMRNRKFGFVLQQFVLIENETVMENVSVPLLFSKEKFSRIDAKVMEMLRMMGIEKLADKKVRTLSGGEKQRTAIARALVNDPDVILADEPTGALDVRNTEMIMQILKEWNQKGKTVIIITHDPWVAGRCEIRYRMMDGKLYKLEETEC